MKSTQMSMSRSEDDEETPTKETLERRKDRKLKDDITDLMVGLLCLFTARVAMLARY